MRSDFLLIPDAAPPASPSLAGAAPSRRTFLKLGAGGGLMLGLMALPAAAQSWVLKPHQRPDAFVRIARDGTVTVQINRLDFGQGVNTALAMLVAEELDADWARVRAELAPAGAAYADPVFGMQMTGGSGSVKHSWQPYRELGARARAMLLAAAAAQLKTDAGRLRTERGFVIAPGGRRIGYGALAQAAAAQPVPASVTLKDARDFRIVGRDLARVNAASIAAGRQDYGIDARRPGMLTALLARPPVFGARLATLDDGAARALPGVRAVLRVPADRGGESVAVVASGYWPAKQGRDALKAVWDTAAQPRVDSAAQLAQYRALAATPGRLARDADLGALAGAPRQLEAEFIFPYLAHAPMEPLNCLFELSEQGCEVWVGSQFQTVDQGAVARVLGFKPEQVKLHTLYAGGGFGRRAVPTSDYLVEAAGVAKALRAQGIRAPLQVVWSREDDIKGGYYRPSALHQATIGFDAQGQILGWDHRIVSQSIVTGTPFEAFLVKDGVDGTTTEGMREPYDVPMKLSVHHPQQNVPVLWWRSVGSTHTAFVMETLIDEVAQACGQDPVAYRLRLMGDRHARHRAALQLAVDRSGYGSQPLPAGAEWGVAVHESFNSVVAYVVQASLQDGKPVLHQVTAGVHCNLAVNPRNVVAQVQGAAMMALSTVLPGAAITLKDGRVQQSNFHDYPVARISDAPDVAVHIVPSADAPTGIGEPGLPPLAPALANALRRVTGKPARELPLRLA